MFHLSCVPWAEYLPSYLDAMMNQLMQLVMLDDIQFLQDQDHVE